VAGLTAATLGTLPALDTLGIVEMPGELGGGATLDPVSIATNTAFNIANEDNGGAATNEIPTDDDQIDEYLFWEWLKTAAGQEWVKNGMPPLDGSRGDPVPSDGDVYIEEPPPTVDNPSGDTQFEPGA
jgi:hypothetical protein